MRLLSSDRRHRARLNALLSLRSDPSRNDTDRRSITGRRASSWVCTDYSPSPLVHAWFTARRGRSFSITVRRRARTHTRADGRVDAPPWTVKRRSRPPFRPFDTVTFAPRRALLFIVATRVCLSCRAWLPESTDAIRWTVGTYARLCVTKREGSRCESGGTARALITT